MIFEKKIQILDIEKLKKKRGGRVGGPYSLGVRGKMIPTNIKSHF